jgi:periplasmic protein TonB
MPEKYLEKPFLFLLCISLLFHLLVGTGIYLMPTEKMKHVEPQATMVDLKDLPAPSQPAKTAKPVPKPKERPKPKPKPKPEPMRKVQPLPVKPLPVPAPRRVVPIPRVPLIHEERPPLPPRVKPPKMARETPLPTKPSPGATAKGDSSKSVSAKSDSNLQPSATAGKPDSVLKAEKGGKDVPRGGGLLKRQKGDKVELAKLFPGAKRMESIEERYRNKYRNLEGGDTRMIDTNDPLIGTYSHRLYLAAQDSYSFHTQGYRGGGIGVVQVTIARDGSVEEVKILEPSNRPALDDLLMKSIQKMSYVGPLPEKWPYDKYRVIWTYIAYPEPAPY